MQTKFNQFLCMKEKNFFTTDTNLLRRQQKTLSINADTHASAFMIEPLIAYSSKLGRMMPSRTICTNKGANFGSN